MDINIRWTDKRLNFSDCIGNLDMKTKNAIWFPEPWLFYLSQRKKLMQVVSQNDNLEAPSTHDINWMFTISLGIHCPFDFTLYPFDKQKCSLKLTDTLFPADFIRYSTVDLSSSPYGIQPALKYGVKYTIMKDPEDLTFFDHYNWSVCGFYIDLERKYSPAIINFYLPSIFIVVIAFCGYVLPSTYLLQKYVIYPKIISDFGLLLPPP